MSHTESPVTFTTVLKVTGTNTTGIIVPPDIVERLGAGKKPKVNVLLNGYAYRSSIAVMGGLFLISVSAENRARAGVEGGQEAVVEISLDTAPREVAVPPDFAAALDAASAARTAFEALSYSNQSRYVIAIEGAKTPETRQRRIEKAVLDLTP